MHASDQHEHPSRRTILASAVAAGSAAAVIGGRARAAAADDDPNWKVSRGRINQSVVHWCFRPMEVEPLAQAAAAMGMKSVELVPPSDWPILKKHGLVCAISGSHGFVRGWNHVENHDYCIERVTEAIDATAAAGFPNVITFSGMRENLSDEEGMRNCVNGIKKVIGHAEKSRVTLCFEVLNSRVDENMKGHPGYQADTIEWGVELCDKVGSPRLKILFDIYHVQIMQGDIIQRIRQYKEYIGHYHTAGVPGRHELDDSQEINYPPIMRAIVETGYTGYVGQEFIPRNEDKIGSLRQAVRLCDV